MSHQAQPFSNNNCIGNSPNRYASQPPRHVADPAAAVGPGGQYPQQTMTAIYDMSQAEDIDGRLSQPDNHRQKPERIVRGQAGDSGQGSPRERPAQHEHSEITRDLERNLAFLVSFSSMVKKTSHELDEILKRVRASESTGDGLDSAAAKIEPGFASLSLEEAQIASAEGPSTLGPSH